MRDLIAKGLMEVRAPRLAPKPQYTPEQWARELAERQAAHDAYVAANRAYHDDLRARGIDPRTMFIDPSLPAFAPAPRMAPKPEFSAQQWQQELAERAKAHGPLPSDRTPIDYTHGQMPYRADQ